MKRLLLLAILILMIPAAAYAQSDVDVDYCDSSNLDRELVIEACTALLELEPRNSSAYFTRAFAEAELGRYEDSIIDYSKVLFFIPRDSLAFNNRGYSFYRLENFLAAIRDYTASLDIDSTYAQARINRGYAYWANEQLELALADAEYLIANDQDAASGYYLRASLAQEAGDHLAAIEDYDRVIELDPSWSSPYLGRGFAHWSSGDFAAAAPDYYTWMTLEAPQVERLTASMAAEPFTLTMDGTTRFVLPIRLNAGDRLTVRAEALADTLDPALVLLDPSGTPIFSDDDGGGGIADMDAVIDGFRIPRDGLYRVVIGFAGGGEIGDVEVGVILQR